MARKHFPVTLDGNTYRLRLTISGQRSLKSRFGEDTMETILQAGTDSERMCALLTEALSWPDSGNSITDGEQFYDMLVDSDYAGQERFFCLAMDIATASGLLTAQQADDAKRALGKAVEETFRSANEAMSQGEAVQEENPTRNLPKT